MTAAQTDTQMECTMEVVEVAGRTAGETASRRKTALVIPHFVHWLQCFDRACPQCHDTSGAKLEGMGMYCQCVYQSVTCASVRKATDSEKQSQKRAPKRPSPWGNSIVESADCRWACQPRGENDSQPQGPRPVVTAWYSTPIGLMFRYYGGTATQDAHGGARVYHHHRPWFTHRISLSCPSEGHGG